ncbi:PREDICTED: uncharacterized protein LOC109342373 [Lupinus angustifolius]|uniref:uncharacterized protein LOC109342373 n=1 Tax=Lupinus angustifolius TaxID=3871 RepID=UPI00092EF8CA|nr:PREDICTED: uncharacterized protein LOC109342373 [Lupinus angustifolius]
MGGCNAVKNAVKNAIVPSMRLSKDVGGVRVNETLFKQVVGNLMYLTVTRPDLMYGVSQISRFMSSSTMSHWLATKRILRYLKVFHGKSKHIDIRFHFLRDLVKDGVVELSYCNSQDQIADIMTKPINFEQFEKLRGMPRMVEVTKENEKESNVILAPSERLSLKRQFTVLEAKINVSLA